MFFQASVEGGGQAPEEPGVGPMGFELMSDWRGMLDERHDGVQWPPAWDPAAVLGGIVTQLRYLSMGIIYIPWLMM